MRKQYLKITVLNDSLPILSVYGKESSSTNDLLKDYLQGVTAPFCMAFMSQSHLLAKCVCKSTFRMPVVICGYVQRGPWMSNWN